MSTFFDALSALRDCLCQAVDDPITGLDPLCTCMVLPGDNYAQDFITSCGKRKDGLGWVQLVNSVPSARFPQQDSLPTNCETPLALRVRMGIVRSIPIPAQGRSLDAATFEALAQRQMDEAALMRRVIVCCWAGASLINNYAPVGPIGGALGGYWEFWITEDND